MITRAGNAIDKLRESHVLWLVCTSVGLAIAITTGVVTNQSNLAALAKRQVDNETKQAAIDEKQNTLISETRIQTASIQAQETMMDARLRRLEDKK